MNFSIYSLLTFSILVISFILFFLLFPKRKNKQVRVFLLLLSIFILWQGIEFAFRFLSLGDSYLFLWRIVLALTVFFGPFLYIFSLLILERKINKKIVFILYASAILIAILSLFTNLFVSSFSGLKAWGRYYRSGSLYFIYVAFLAFAMGISSFNFYQAYKEKEEKKKMIRIIAIGFWITMGGAFFAELIPNLLDINFPPLAGFFVLFLILAIIKAMYIYQLFEIKIRQIGLGKKILFAFLFVSISSSFIFGFSAYFQEKINTEQKIQDDLELSLTEKAKYLDFYLKEKKDDLSLLSLNISIRNTFNQKLKEEANYAKKQIKIEAEKVAEEIELFLREHPKMNLDDLQSSAEFQKIAVQKIGQTGYTALTDYNSLVCRFHKDPKIVDMNLQNLQSKLPEFWNIMSKSRGGYISEGSYSWLDPDGSRREKYMYIAPLKLSTNDGVYLNVAATTYLDEFDAPVRLMEEAENFLKQYTEKYNFENLFLIGTDDRVWWETKKEFGLGTNMNSLGPEKEKFFDIYKKTKLSQGAIIFNCLCEKDKAVKVFIMMPVRNRFTQDLIGVIGGEFSHEKFDELINPNNSVNKNKITYLVDAEKNVISGVDNNKKIEESINFKNCFEHRNFETYKVNKAHQESQHYYNNNNEEVLGSHFYIKNLDWCLLSEIPKKEAEAPLLKLKYFFMVISLLIILLSVLLSFLFSRALVAPILKLTQGAREFARKNFKYRVNINTRDELEVLGKIFNQVGGDLAKADKEEKDYQFNLEKEIKLKTKQLKAILDDIQKDKDNLENQQKAMLNILEDANESQIDLKNSKNNLEKKQKEMESIISLSNKLSKTKDFEQIADVLYKHLNNIFAFKATALFIFSRKEMKVDIFRIYCNEKMGVDIYDDAKFEIKKALLNSPGLKEKEIKNLLLLNPRIFGKKPGSLKVHKKYQKNCFVLRYGLEVFGVICFRTKDKIDLENKNLLDALLLTTSVFISGIMSISKSQHSKTKSLVDSTNNGIIMFDEKRNISLINPAALRMAQTNEEENKLDKIFLAVKEKGEDLGQKIDKCIKSGELMRIDEIQINNKFIEIVINPIKDDMGKIMGVAMIMHDITQMKQIDNMKTEFVSVASHQLRTPLTAIKLFTEMLMNEQVGKLKKDQKDYLDHILESTDRMVRLVNDLLNVSRIESGRLSIVPEPTFMETFISTIISEAEPLAQAKKCKIEFIKPKKKLAKISIDKNLVRQVIHNLITNAIKYSHDDGGFVKIELGEYNKKNILIKVSDNGIGIPRKLQERMFQKFFRADNAVKTETEGTGLGLYVAKMIVKTSGGKIWFESKENKGTTFYVTLPKKGMKKKEGEKGLSLS